jgi:hypothetical protein
MFIVRFRKSIVFFLFLVGFVTASSAQVASAASVDEARRAIVSLFAKVDQLEKLIERVAAKGRQDIAEQQTQEQAKRKEIEQLLQNALELAQGALDRAGSTAEEQALHRRGSLELLNQIGQLRRDLQQIEQVRQELAQLRRDKENLAEFFTTQQRELAKTRQAQADLSNKLAEIEQVRQELVEVKLDSAEALRLVRDALSKVGNSVDDGNRQPPASRGR